MNLRQLRALGFDDSVRTGTRRLQVRCSQCEATAINGVPCHEQRCPNIMRKEDEDESEVG